jgi:hypothetical protein
MMRLVPRTFLMASLLSLGCSGGAASPEALCADTPARVGTTVEVAGYDDLVLVGATAAACEPGTCCNAATWAPVIDCPSGPDILLQPAAGADAATVQCSGSLGSDASAACGEPSCPAWRTAIGTLSAEVAGPTGEPVHVLEVDAVTL